jgi:hypothetical protein
VNQDRLICGLATLFNTVAHGGLFWTRKMFTDWLSIRMAIPLRVSHSVIAVESAGLVITDVGTARLFAPVLEPMPGLLTLCEVDEGRWGDALLRDVEHHQDQPWLPPYGFSLGCHVVPGEAVMPYEVSLTTRPQFSDAKVIAVGREAQTIWDMLTPNPIAQKGMS